MHPIARNIHQLYAADYMERLQQQQRAWLAYNGESPKPLKVRTGQPDDNVQVNYARTIVNTGVSFLFGDNITFSLAQPAGAAAAAGEPREIQWLNQVWAANRKMTLLHKFGINGGVTGHGFLKIAPPAAGARQPFPRLINLDPATVNVIWNPDDVDLVDVYVIEYTAMQYERSQRRLMPVNRRQLIERDGSRWVIIDQTARLGGDYQDTQAPVYWPYEWAPIIDCQNLPAANAYYGEPDIPKDILELSRSVDFVLSNTGRIIRFHAHPKTIGKGFKAADIDVGVDGLLCLPNAAADLKNLEMASDLGSSIVFFEKLKEAIYTASATPEVATGKVEDLGQISGVALQVLFRPLILKTMTKRLLTGDMLVELNRRLLEMGGFANRETTVGWSQMLPINALEERNVLLIDQQLGASKDSTLDKAGYDPAVEKQKRKEEAKEGRELGNQMLGAFNKGQNPDADPDLDDEDDDAGDEGDEA
ncbi:MAG TPA: phage portal protein [Herpetosiphonaceae bacterium]